MSPSGLLSAPMLNDLQAQHGGISMLKRFLALFYGLVAYLLFLGAFLYTVGFISDTGVPKNIDTGTASPVAVALAIDLALLAIFGLQHSIMARQGFKRVWTMIVPQPVERATFVLAADFALILILWQWRPLPGVVWDFTGTAAEPVLQALFWIGWGVLLLSTFLLNHFELFGLTQVWNYATNRVAKQSTFKTPSLYRVVRHPLYLGFVIAFWSTPRMTVSRLVFAAVCTAYILVGIYFEERDLIAHYGLVYREYRSRVPMLIPFFRRPKSEPMQQSAKSKAA